jgi:lipoyl(octanoyl) transferase
VNVLINKKTSFIDLGLKDYREAWDFQTELFNQNLEIKSTNRNAAAEAHLPTRNYLIFCEHPHVYTLGKSGREEHLLVDQRRLSEIDATYYHINRGGDITYHGPGQIVVYPILDLENFFTDIHKYMRLLEESVIRTCSSFGIQAGRIKGLTGVWVDYEGDNPARKICALGVKTSRWVTLHGLALNVNSDLTYFKNIVPCGIDDKQVTSMENELGTKQDMQRVIEVLKSNLVELFEMELVS